MAVETEAATPGLALAETDINWHRLDKTRFHIIGAILFTAQSALLHPTAVVKTRMQVDGSGLSHMRGTSVFRHILRSDGIHGLFRGFGTSAIGSLPGRVLALTSLEVSKDMTFKYTEHLDMPDATRVGIANGVAGFFSNLLSCVYYVPLDVICQRLMVQGLPGTAYCSGPFDVVCKVVKAEGFRGMYRGFGLTAVTQSPASALWWGVYGAAQHIIWRSLDYRENSERKPSHVEMAIVQAAAGMVAGACSSVVTTPIDTVKTRLQVMDNYGAGRPSVMKTARTLLKEDGWWGFYRGFGPRFFSMSLYGTTMIVTYELISMLTSPFQQAQKFGRILKQNLVLILDLGGSQSSLAAFGNDTSFIPWLRFNFVQSEIFDETQFINLTRVMILQELANIFDHLGSGRTLRFTVFLL